MKKYIAIFALLILTFLNCKKNIQSEPKFEFPEYRISESDFKEKISQSDSLIVTLKYESKSEFASKSSANKLLIELFLDEKKEIDENYLNELNQKVVESAKEDILNIRGYDIIEVNIIQKNKTIKSIEEIINK